MFENNVLGKLREFASNYLLETLDKGGGTIFVCSVCKHQCRKRSLAENHIESIHFPGTFVYACKYCGLQLPTRKKYFNHTTSCKNELVSQKRY